MKYLRVSFLLILLVGVMALLTACGGESPTATVAVTSAATATTGTADTAPTAVVADTPTTAAVVADTPTTAAMVADTPTTAAMVADTPTTAAMTADTPTASTGSGTGTGITNPTLQAAAAAMKGVKSYHFILTTETGATGGQTIEGDMIPPDKMSMTINMSAGGQAVETKMIRIGGTTWTNVAGQWTQMQVPVAVNPTDLTNIGNVSDVEDLGDATVDGIATKHLRYKSTMADPTGAGASITGTGEVWIDKATNYIVQTMSSSDVAGAGTTKVTMKMSKFNDPSIKIEPPQ